MYNTKFAVMNTAEIKLDLFRRIDRLQESELEKVYNKFIALLSTTSNYNLSEPEKKAVEEALKVSNQGKIHTHDEVMEEAKRKYPNLKFK